MSKRLFVAHKTYSYAYRGEVVGCVVDSNNNEKFIISKSDGSFFSGKIEDYVRIKHLKEEI